MNRPYPSGRPTPAPQEQSAPKLPVFTVAKITPVDTGTLKCFADIEIGRGPNAVTVCKWRLIQQNGQKPWLSAPQECWTTSSGEKRYTNLFVFPKAWGPSLTDAVIAAWEAQTERATQSGEGA